MTTTAPEPVAPTLPASPAPAGEAPHFGYKPALDGLRAVAVMAVVAYHFGAGWLQGGFLGVDMFFVLSGYLITSLLLIEWARSDTIRFGAFWARRARRLLPALFVLLIVVAVWGRVVLSSDQWGALRGDAIWSLFYGANWHAVWSGQSYFTAEPSMLRHMWSLAIEEQFYLIWPLVVFAALKLSRGRHGLLVGTCVVGTALSVLVMNVKFEPGTDPSRVYYGTDARASQLLIGALLAILLIHWGPRVRGSRLAVQWLGVLGAVGVAIMFWAARDQGTFLYRGGFIVFAVCTAAMITAIVQRTRNPMQAGLSVRPVRWVGQVSYGVYLWHWPVWVALSAARMQQWGIDVSGWRLSILHLAVTFGIAALSYYLVELPIRQKRFTKKWTARILVPAGFAVTLLVIWLSTVGATTDQLARAPGTVLRSGDTPTVTTVPGSVAPPTRTVLLLGDSVAYTLGDALTSSAAGDGVALRSIGRLGCGMTTGIALDDQGNQIEWSPTCASDTVGYENRSLAEVQPDTVMWLSTWELSDYEVDGKRLEFGTPAFDRWLLGEMESARARFADRGARLALLTVPPTAENPLRKVDPEQARRAAHLNDLMRRFAAEHPDDVVVVDLAEIVCPGGAPCPTTVDGIVLRPKDGGHYEADGAAWVAPRLLDALYEALRTQPVTTTTAR